jgi:hypothetical protein
MASINSKIQDKLNNIQQLEVPKNVIDGSLVSNAIGYYNSKLNPSSIVKLIYTDFINSVKKDIESKKKLLESTKKIYSERIQAIKKTRLSDEEQVRALIILETTFINEIKIINNQIENLTKSIENKKSIYSNRENAKKYLKKKLIPLDNNVSLTKTISDILISHTTTLLNNGKLAVYDRRYLIASLLSITSIILTTINLKNYGIDNDISEIEDEINKIYNGEVTNPEQSLIYLKRKINIVVAKINVRERSLVRVMTIIDIVKNIINISQLLVLAAEIAVQAFGAVPLAPFSLGNTAQRLLDFLKDLLSYISIFLTVIDNIYKLLYNDIQYQKNRLSAIFLLFETSIPASIKSVNLQASIELNSLGKVFNILTPEQFIRVLNSGDNYNLGYLDGFDYKGFKFYLKEEFNLNFVVRGYKRRYAVATNLLGKEIIQSDYSFTLDPPVLVDQIKVEIDLKNLSA